MPPRHKERKSRHQWAKKCPRFETRTQHNVSDASNKEDVNTQTPIEEIHIASREDLESVDQGTEPDLLNPRDSTSLL